MDILAILRQELQQALRVREITVEYVAALPDQDEHLSLTQRTASDAAPQKYFWLPWSDYLGAWVSSHGTSIQVLLIDQACNLDPRKLILGFTASLTGICLNLQGQVAIHANAVVFNNKAVAFIGYSGAGKSTLSAFCAGRGARFVTDDVLVINEQKQVLPGNPRIKLYPETGASLGLDASQATNYKIFYHPETHLGGTCQQQNIPLGSLYLLTSTEEDLIYTETVPAVQAAFELMNHGYEVGRFIAYHPHLFDAYLQLVQQYPVQRLYYPHDFSRLPAVYDFLLKESHKQ
jgi:energy-coupling factor transporter ATP-binding protein EcfA2